MKYAAIATQSEAIWATGRSINDARTLAEIWHGINAPDQPCPALKFIEIHDQEFDDLKKHGFRPERHGHILQRAPVYHDEHGPCMDGYSVSAR